MHVAAVRTGLAALRCSEGSTACSARLEFDVGSLRGLGPLATTVLPVPFGFGDRGQVPFRGVIHFAKGTMLWVLAQDGQTRGESITLSQFWHQ